VTATGGASSGGASSGGASSGGASSGGASSGGATASGGSTGSGGGSATACTGKPGSKRGKVNATVTAGGAQRTFIYYAPQGLDANQPVPIVIVPHGFTMSGQAMYDITKHTTIADREKFIAIFPDGTAGNPWNVGAGVCGAGAAVVGAGNDQAFVDEMIKYAEADQCVDKDHIYMTGFSMGGYFSNETGCLRSNIRAVGPHSGGSHDLTACPVQHKPVILFHFKNDSLIAYDCGTGARDRWVAKNGCTKTAPEVVTVKGGSCEYYKGCPADGQVAMCSFDAQTGQGETIAGHAWSGGNPNAFAIPNTESAAELGWAFFKKYAW
jgi:polyhydroxybutyrate depolymerase